MLRISSEQLHASRYLWCVLTALPTPPRLCHLASEHGSFSTDTHDLDAALISLLTCCARLCKITEDSPEERRTVSAKQVPWPARGHQHGTWGRCTRGAPTAAGQRHVQRQARGAAALKCGEARSSAGSRARRADGSGIAACAAASARRGDAQVRRGEEQRRGAREARRRQRTMSERQRCGRRAPAMVTHRCNVRVACVWCLARSPLVSLRSTLVIRSNETD